MLTKPEYYLINVEETLHGFEIYPTGLDTQNGHALEGFFVIKEKKRMVWDQI
jgi:hypothetical protein